MTRRSLALVSAVALIAISTSPVAAAVEAPSPLAPASSVPDAAYEFKATASLRDPRINSSATLLPDGRVLVIGGEEVASAETWDPVTEEWSPAGTMAQPRGGHSATLLSATLLSDGRVLVSGGESGDDGEGGVPEVDDEVWDPTTGSFNGVAGRSPASVPAAAELPGLPMQLAPATDALRTLLPDGRVLVTGGLRPDHPGCERRCSLMPSDAAWIWDPASDAIVSLEPMTVGRWGHTATLLDDGRVLLVGSHTHGPRDRSAEIFQPADE